MKIGVLVDANGFYAGDFLCGMEKPHELSLVGTLPPEGLHILKYDFESDTWVEGLSQAELDALHDVIIEPTMEERVAAVEDALLSVLGI